MFSWFKSSKQPPPFPGPDYSNVDSRSKAASLVEAGELIKLQLLPAVFGGDAQDHNMVFVPPFVLDIKAGIDNDTVMSLVQQGMVQRYSASPKYHGKSVVPMAIEIKTSPANFNAVLKIWGPILNESS